jgi:hypothetical protein
MNEAVNQGGVNIAIDDRGLATVEFFHPLSNSLPGKSSQNWPIPSLNWVKMMT